MTSLSENLAIPGRVRDEELAGLDRDHQTFLSIVEEARRDLSAGRLESAVVRAQIAGTFAWMNPCGIFASQELEELLVTVARSTQTAPLHRPKRPAADVLHVVTQVYQSGGSTQGVTSWIEQDADRRHRVVLTRQGTGPVPRKLSSALRSPTADLFRLDSRPGGLIERGAALAGCAADCGVVVLHTHPYDVVPMLAFCDGKRHPPIISVNHADHVFWTGVGVAQTLMNMRDSGQELAIARRGVSAGRCQVMARPLRLRERTLSRTDAKQRSGVDERQIVLLTAADASKYRPIGPVSFLDLVVPVVERYPNVVLLAAGPTDEGDWREANLRTNGRVRALGRLSDVATVHQAADMYIDSFPFSSLTSLLESGAYGTVTASFHGHPPSCAVLGADTRGVDDHMVTSREPTDFQQRICALIEDRSRREELGSLTAAEIRASHTGTGWRSAADALYAFASAQPEMPRVIVPARQVDELDALVALVMKRTGFSDGALGALSRNVSLLPVRDRLSAWLHLSNNGKSGGLAGVLPEWSHPHFARLRRRVRGEKE